MRLRKRILSFLLAILLLLPMMPQRSLAATYYSKSDLENIRATILPNAKRATYVNNIQTMILLFFSD